MYDVDLFETPQATTDGLRAKGRAITCCYLNAGSREDWRPDAAMFPAEAIGKGLDTRSEGAGGHQGASRSRRGQEVRRGRARQRRPLLDLHRLPADPPSPG